MNLNKIGKYLAVISFILFVVFTGLIVISESLLVFIVSAAIIFYLSFCSGLALIFYHSPFLVRRKAIRSISIISLLVFVFGWINKFMHWPGAGISIMLSSFLFSFAGLPLIIKSRYEKRKLLLSGRAMLLSSADLFSIVAIMMGLLFRVMHWPGGDYLVIMGVGVLMVTFVAWNASFKNEVKLRLSAEERLKEKIKEVEEKHLIIEEKNKEITDSINYAKRIQEAILPSADLIKSHLPDSFIYYQPKDIVAGDFYWMETVGSGQISAGSENHSCILIAAADCTGHGVPGALVSVICSNALNRSVNEFNLSDPGKILDKTRELVLESFSKSDKDVKDGMDISLLSIQKPSDQNVKDDKVIVKWAGANNPLWYLSSSGENVDRPGNDGNNLVLKEIKADKQPIGKTDDSKPFTTHTLNLNKGDTLYLFTDGYADQFGGPKGKKFKYKQFEELLVSTRKLSLNEQFRQISMQINNWKGNLEQVDDICVIGIRL